MQGLILGLLCSGIGLSVAVTLWLTSQSTKTAASTSFSIGWNSTGITVAGIVDTTGTAATLFNHPICLTMDSSNTLYISDNLNHRVQKWLAGASSGTTVAGQSNGVAGAALNYLSYPSDVALDSSGNIYVLDGGNQRVVYWSIGASSGTIVAGNGVAGSANDEFSNPLGLVLDSSSGTIYIADSGNHRVMQYLSGASSGTVVAGGNGQGTSDTQLSNPRGLYYESSTNSLLIANNQAHNIVRWVIGASSWTLVAGDSNGLSGGTSILLNYPTDVTLDSISNMYVSDEGNQRVQFFLAGQSTGTTIAGVTGISGNNATLLFTPSSLTVDSQFNLYVVDYNNARVQKFLHY